MNLRALAVSSVVVLASACGAPESDGGTDAGAFDGSTFHVMLPDAGRYDAGSVAFDAGPATPPPRTVFGSMTVNGTQYTLQSGYGTQSSVTHQLRLGTDDAVAPRILVSILFPADAGATFGTTCASAPTPFLFSAQYLTDAGVAFFTLNPTCTVSVSSVAQAVDQDYVGTFSGTLEYEPRSAADAGFPVLNITGGSFTARRSF